MGIPLGRSILVISSPESFSMYLTMPLRDVPWATQSTISPAENLYLLQISFHSLGYLKFWVLLQISKMVQSCNQSDLLKILRQECLELSKHPNKDEIYFSETKSKFSKFCFPKCTSQWDELFNTSTSTW